MGVSTLGRTARLGARAFLTLLGAAALAANLFATEPTNRATADSGSSAGVSANSGPHFDIQDYVIKYNPAVFTNAPGTALAPYTGTNIDLDRLVQAASTVLREFAAAGYPSANISIAPEQIINGVVTMNVYEGVFPQVLISGRSFRNVGETEASASTNSPPGTNAEPHFSIVGYEVVGNDLLSDDTLESIFSKYVGTNVTRDDIFNAQKDLVLEYRARGYATVNVVRPPQRITNGIIRLEVTEGTLALINVVGNLYYSSNNVMRALPSLKTNMILNDKVLAAEFDRANANQDRQLSALLTNGPTAGTSELDLLVKDRFPLHGKVELNNQASPGTPELRLNGSAVYNNLWQLNHSLGVQYSASPEAFKQGDQWKWFDQPLVANYSGFYRMPLGNPASVADVVENQPGSFGFDEATRKFNLPPPSGTPELNIYASRSTIDTGVLLLNSQVLYDVPGVRTVTRQDSQQDLTVNNSLGFRLSAPLPRLADVVSTVSGGLDYKTYDLRSLKTNNFNFVEITLNALGIPNPPVISQVNSPVPPTYTEVHYLPLTIRWDGSRRDDHGLWSAGLGNSVNFFGGLFEHSSANFQQAAGSSRANGLYDVLTATLSREQAIYKDWRLVLRADGQWANQPLISNEQFGTGGVASVRGYQEGQFFGDTGWHVSVEQRTPGHIVGMINGRDPLVIRGSLYMDYAESCLLDPQGRPGQTPLWGTGFGLAASVGSSWEARFLFSEPLLRTSGNEAYQPFFNFSLTAQF